MFKLQPLAGGKFSLERERGSSPQRQENEVRISDKHKSNFQTILDSFEEKSKKYTFDKPTKSATLLSTPTKRGRGTVSDNDFVFRNANFRTLICGTNVKTSSDLNLTLNLYIIFDV